MRAIRAATVAMMLLCSSTECAPCDGTESDGECMVPAAAALVQASTQRRQVEQMNDTGPHQGCIVSFRVVSFSILAYSIRFVSFRLVRESFRFVSF